MTNLFIPPLPVSVSPEPSLVAHTHLAAGFELDPDHGWAPGLASGRQNSKSKEKHNNPPRWKESSEIPDFD